MRAHAHAFSEPKSLACIEHVPSLAAALGALQARQGASAMQSLQSASAAGASTPGSAASEAAEEDWLPAYFTALIAAARAGWVDLPSAAAFLQHGARRAVDIIYEAVGTVGPPHRPESGSLFIVDERRLPNFRDDGYSYEGGGRRVPGPYDAEPDGGGGGAWGARDVAFVMPAGAAVGGAAPAASSPWAQLIRSPLVAGAAGGGGSSSQLLFSPPAAASSFARAGGSSPLGGGGGAAAAAPGSRMVVHVEWDVVAAAAVVGGPRRRLAPPTTPAGAAPPLPPRLQRRAIRLPWSLLGGGASPASWGAASPNGAHTGRGDEGDTRVWLVQYFHLDAAAADADAPLPPRYGAHGEPVGGGRAASSLPATVDDGGAGDAGDGAEVLLPSAPRTPLPLPQAPLEAAPTAFATTG